MNAYCTLAHSLRFADCHVLLVGLRRVGRVHWQRDSMLLLLLLLLLMEKEAYGSPAQRSPVSRVLLPMLLGLLATRLLFVPTRRTHPPSPAVKGVAYKQTAFCYLIVPDYRKAANTHTHTTFRTMWMRRTFNRNDRNQNSHEWFWIDDLYRSKFAKDIVNRNQYIWVLVINYRRRISWNKLLIWLRKIQEFKFKKIILLCNKF